MGHYPAGRSHQKIRTQVYCGHKGMDMLQALKQYSVGFEGPKVKKITLIVQFWPVLTVASLACS